MRCRPQSPGKLLRSILAAAACLAWMPDTHAREMLGGIAVATSERGNIRITDSGGNSTRLSLHETLQINGSTIKTEKGAHLFLALSNGTAIGVGENTEIIVELFEQRPYPPEKESLKHEPSVSELSIRLITGTIAVASKNLSPLSHLRILLSTGELRIHSTKCVVRDDELGVHLATYDANLTYYYPDADKREFLVELQSIRISKQSAALGRIAEITDMASLPAEWKTMAEATQHASERVFFKSGGSAAQPKPVLVVSPDYFKQAPARPYEFAE